MGIPKVLIVDDEDNIRELEKEALSKIDCFILEASDGRKAIDIFFETKDVSLILLDITMSDMDGFDVLKEIRDFSDVPVIMIAARRDENEELKGFALGADDYISRPFSLKVLAARTESLLRRAKIAEKEDVLSIGPIRIDNTAHQVYVDDEPIDLSYKEYKLLCFFVKNRGIALSREKILDSVWDYDYFGDARTIDTHVKKLRSKLGKEAGNLIKTVWGMGYKMEEDPVND